MMKYWIIVDERAAGPFSAQQLLDSGLMPDTLVWCEGLTDWVRADSVSELAEGLQLRDVAPAQPEQSKPEEQPMAEGCQIPQPQVLVDPYQWPRPNVERPTEQYAQQPQNQTSSAPQPEMEPCPPSYVVWAILATLFCCTIVGIPAIIFASMTKSAYYRGDMAKAKVYSERAQWFIIAAIVLGVVSWPFQIAWMFCQ